MNSPWTNPFNRFHSTSKRRLMVISAKGGVGKSTITVNLAAALKARGKSVGIFDADVHGPNIPALLGITQKRTLRLESHPESMLPIYVQLESPDARPIQPIIRYGIRVMSLGLLVGEQQTLNPNPEDVGRLITLLLARVDWGGADIVLLDMPPGTGQPLTAILETQSIDGIVLVAIREKLAHLDNGRLINVLQARQAPVIGVVENMTHVVCPRCGELIELYPTPVASQSLYESIPVLAAIPFHPALIRQAEGGKPLPLREPDSAVAQPLFAVADQIIDYLQKR